MDELTGQERAILAAIRHYWATKGIAPSLKELADATGMRSIGTLHDRIGRLEYLGYLRRTPNIPRSLVLLTPDKASELALSGDEKAC